MGRFDVLRLTRINADVVEFSFDQSPVSLHNRVRIVLLRGPLLLLVVEANDTVDPIGSATLYERH